MTDIMHPHTDIPTVPMIMEQLTSTGIFRTGHDSLDTIMRETIERALMLAYAKGKLDAIDEIEQMKYPASFRRLDDAHDGGS